MLSGDTALSNIDKDYKVNCRLGIIANQKFVNITSIEVERKPSSSKVKEDHVKLVLEAKTTMNRIVNQFNFIHPSSINVYSLQICGLKGDLLKTTTWSLAYDKSGLPNAYIERICFG